MHEDKTSGTGYPLVVPEHAYDVDHIHISVLPACSSINGLYGPADRCGLSSASSDYVVDFAAPRSARTGPQAHGCISSGRPCPNRATNS